MARNSVITEARKPVRLWDEIYSPEHKDTGYEDIRVERAIERLRKALDGL